MYSSNFKLTALLALCLVVASAVGEGTYATAVSKPPLDSFETLTRREKSLLYMWPLCRHPLPHIRDPHGAHCDVDHPRQGQSHQDRYGVAEPDNAGDLRVYADCKCGAGVSDDDGDFLGRDNLATTLTFELPGLSLMVSPLGPVVVSHTRRTAGTSLSSSNHRSALTGRR